MKCQNCGQNEATFYFKSVVNGHVTEQHLCQECAKKMGLTAQLRDSFNPMRMFSRRSFFSPTLLDSFFSGMNTNLLEEFPEPEESAVTRKNVEQEEAPQYSEEQKQFINQRKRNALQAQLDAAIASEDFESAIKLRDELRALPQD